MSASAGSTSVGAVVEGVGAVGRPEVELGYDLLIDVGAIGVWVQGVIHQKLAMPRNACV